MTAVAEIEATAIHAPGTDLTPYQPQALEEYRPRILMEAAEAAEMDSQLRSMMKAVLVENTDYGTVPGSTKPSLWKPGAEKLLQWFGFGHRIEKAEIERNEDGTRLGVTYRCTVFKEMGDGREVTVSTCEGYTGYDEDTFYTSEEAAKRKAEANERKWAAKDNRAPRPEKWQFATEYRAPWNSLIKIAQKRALVGAALQATSASTLFTQDLEDMRADASPSPFVEAAEARINALQPEVRNALVRWYRGQKWAAPAKWSPEQWCEALQVAGAIAAQWQKPEPPPAGTATASAAPGPEAAAAETWLDGALAKAPSLPTVKACHDLWREGTARVHAGEVAKPDAKRVQDILTARIADLRQAALSVFGDDDPWAVKIGALASSYEAGGAIAEVLRLRGGGHVDAARARQITGAITACFPDATAETAVAA